MRLTLLVCLLFLTSVQNAHAYLDPGAGSVMMQAMLASVAALVVAIRLYPRRLKLFIGRVFNRFQNKLTQQKSSDVSE